MFTKSNAWRLANLKAKLVLLRKEIAEYLATHRGAIHCSPNDRMYEEYDVCEELFGDRLNRLLRTTKKLKELLGAP